MVTRDDFTSDEWNLIFQAPAFAALYVVQAGPLSPAAVYEKMLAGILAITETARPRADSALVREIRAAIGTGQRPRYPAVFPGGQDEARIMALDSCLQAARLLGQRAPDHEASIYIEWLIAIGAAVAAAPGAGPAQCGETADACAAVALGALAEALKSV